MSESDYRFIAHPEADGTATGFDVFIGHDPGFGHSFTALMRCEHGGANGVLVLPERSVSHGTLTMSSFQLSPDTWRLPGRYSDKARRRRTRMARKRRRGFA